MPVAKPSLTNKVETLKTCIIATKNKNQVLSIMLKEAGKKLGVIVAAARQLESLSTQVDLAKASVTIEIDKYKKDPAMTTLLTKICKEADDCTNAATNLLGEVETRKMKPEEELQKTVRSLQTQVTSLKQTIEEDIKRREEISVAQAVAYSSAHDDSMKL